MRVASHESLAVVDPYLPPANEVESRRRRVPEGKRLGERVVLLVAIPIDEARIDARHGPARRREYGSSGRRGKVDPLVDAAAIVARRAGQKLEVCRDVAALDRQGEHAPQTC